jgi:predicted RND superfamily exporter protein
LFTALTTAAGLASLGSSPIVPTALFGLLSAGGVMMIYVVVIFVSPAFLVHWDHKPWPQTRFGNKWLSATVRCLSGFAIRHPVPVVAGICLVLLLGTSQFSRIVVETNLQHFFLADHPIRIATDRVDEKLVGTNSLDVVFEADKRNSLVEPELLNGMKAFQLWVEGLAEVDKATSMVDFVEEMHWGFHEEDPAFRTIPDDSRLISQYLLIYDADDLWDFVDRDLRIARMTLNVNVHSANDVAALMDEMRAYLEEHFPKNTGLTVDIAGFGRLLADMEDLIITGQVTSLFGALAIIMLLMLMQWRSLRDAAICMIPNLSPILLIFILMGAFGIWLDVATAMIASVAVGIAVDDTIHLYHGFISRQRRHGNAVVALARTYRQAGRAITTTTIVLCAQFLVVTTSDFVPTANFGLLTSVGLLTAWLFDIVLLPAILILVFKNRSNQASAGTNDKLEQRAASGS